MSEDCVRVFKLLWDCILWLNSDWSMTEMNHSALNGVSLPLRLGNTRQYSQMPTHSLTHSLKSRSNIATPTAMKSRAFIVIETTIRYWMECPNCFVWLAVKLQRTLTNRGQTVSTFLRRLLSNLTQALISVDRHPNGIVWSYVGLGASHKKNLSCHNPPATEIYGEHCWGVYEFKD